MSNNSSQNRTLIVGPAWIGDMVMAQALFRLLKLENPGLLIDVLAPDWTHSLLDRMPEVHTAIVLPFKHGELALKRRYQIGKILRENNYKQAIILPNSFKSSLIPFFAKVPIRTGFRGELRYGFLNDLRKLNKKKLPLMVERFITLGLDAKSSTKEKVFSMYPLPKLVITEQLINTVLQKYNLEKPTVPMLALCPGAEFGSSKQWPPDYFAQIANDRLDLGWQIWLFGSKNDIPASQAIQAQTQNRCIDLTGKTSLCEAIDLLSLADIIATHDSGLMHIAAALDKPLVAIYGSSSADHTPPLTKQAKIVSIKLDCQPCFKRECPFKHHRCMKGLEPKLVLDAIKELIEVK